MKGRLGSLEEPSETSLRGSRLRGDLPGPLVHTGWVSVLPLAPLPHSGLVPPEGGGRRAWHSTWFQSKHPFTQKADFVRESNVGPTDGVDSGEPSPLWAEVGEPRNELPLPFCLAVALAHRPRPAPGSTAAQPAQRPQLHHWARGHIQLGQQR